MRMMMDKWRHVSTPVWKLKIMLRNYVIKVLSLKDMNWQSNKQKLFMLVQYWTFALKLNKYFLHLWILLHFQTLLDIKSWPKDDLFWQLWDQQVDWTLYGTFDKNGWDVTKISREWTHLKSYIFPMLHSSPKESYVEIWHQIIINNEVMAESQNVHIFEILMIVTFTMP